MILTVTPNPCVDKTLFLESLRVGEKNVGRMWSAVAGGKGCNVARAVKALGRQATAFVVIGGPTGDHVLRMIEDEDGLPCISVWVEGYTRVIMTVLEESIHRQTPLFEPGPDVSAEELDEIVATFEEAAPQFRVVTFNGTVPDRSMETLYERAIPIARDAGLLTVLDAHGPEFARGVAAVPTMVKPNVHEAEELLGFAVDSEPSRWRAVEALHEQGIEWVVLSLGAEGALFSRGGEQIHAVPPEIEEVNAVGSGDALVGVCAIALQEGWDLERMATQAVAAGTANAMSWDIGHFDASQVEMIAANVQIRRRR